ncbi:MAG: tRNA 2-thiouridine(34) synthase MnmA [Actinobacteria bacterium]|nr:tRNA 2-thiouridine(34) synthase MnmA [Actinomycetota bacterium]
MKNLNSNLILHFEKPHNIGEISSPDAVGRSDGPECPGNIIFTARINKNIIRDIKFKAYGCNYTIAASSYLTTLIKNKDILESTLITEKELEKYLGKFPSRKRYVLTIAINALQNLISDYISKPDTGNIYKKKNKKVAVAMSGGIDSSMAAKILKDSSWEVIGITMKLLPDNFDWKNNTKTCCSRKDIEAARKVSLKLNIPHVVINFIQPFEEKIINPFCLEYQHGRTPNPCVECNKYIKFGVLLEKIKTLGASYLATGHYCRIDKSSISGLYEIKKGFDKSKDQSYVLWKLNQDQISQIKTPMGMFSKDEVRKKTNSIFPFLEKKSESQDICFIPDDNFHSFLASKLKNIKEGVVININGKNIGTHKGCPFYTIGQRKGLGISYSKPLYVKEIIPEKNIIIAGEEKDIMQKSLKVKNTNFISGNLSRNNFKAMVKIRYNFKETSAEIKIEDKETATIIFDKPQKAIAPGQSAVFYTGDTLIGGGVIIKS